MTVNDVSANKESIDKLVSELNSTHGSGTAVGVVADVTSSTDVQNLIKGSVEKLGPLTVMIANAGIAQVSPILDISDEDAHRMVSWSPHLKDFAVRNIGAIRSLFYPG